MKFTLNYYIFFTKFKLRAPLAKFRKNVFRWKPLKNAKIFNQKVPQADLWKLYVHKNSKTFIFERNISVAYVFFFENCLTLLPTKCFIINIYYKETDKYQYLCTKQWCGLWVPRGTVDLFMGAPHPLFSSRGCSSPRAPTESAPLNSSIIKEMGTAIDNTGKLLTLVK